MRTQSIHRRYCDRHSEAFDQPVRCRKHTILRIELGHLEGQPATLFTDAGGSGIPGTVTYISPKAEFTPRNVQTSEERSKLVYRVKITADNREGILKPGMPVEAELR